MLSRQRRGSRMAHKGSTEQNTREWALHRDPKRQAPMERYVSQGTIFQGATKAEPGKNRVGCYRKSDRCRLPNVRFVNFGVHPVRCIKAERARTVRQDKRGAWNRGVRAEGQRASSVRRKIRARQFANCWSSKSSAGACMAVSCGLSCARLPRSSFPSFLVPVLNI